MKDLRTLNQKMRFASKLPHGGLRCLDPHTRKQVNDGENEARAEPAPPAIEVTSLNPGVRLMQYLLSDCG